MAGQPLQPDWLALSPASLAEADTPVQPLRQAGHAAFD